MSEGTNPTQKQKNNAYQHSITKYKFPRYRFRRGYPQYLSNSQTRLQRFQTTVEYALFIFYTLAQQASTLLPQSHAPEHSYPSEHRQSCHINKKNIHMIRTKENLVDTDIFNVFRSYVETTETPSFILLPEDEDVNQVKFYRFTAEFDDPDDNDTGNSKGGLTIEGEPNTMLDVVFQSILSQLPTGTEALKVCEDCAVYLMSYLARKTIRAFNDENYIDALCYAKAFELQYESVDKAGADYEDEDLVWFISDIIPYILYRYHEHINNEQE